VVKYKAAGARGRTVADAGRTTKVWAHQFYAGQGFGQDERSCNIVWSRLMRDGKLLQNRHYAH
jgi:hypothetical protein